MEELSLDEYKSIFMIDAEETVIKYFDEIVTEVLGQYFRLKKCEKNTFGLESGRTIEES